MSDDMLKCPKCGRDMQCSTRRSRPRDETIVTRLRYCDYCDVMYESRAVMPDWFGASLYADGQFGKWRQIA